VSGLFDIRGLEPDGGSARDIWEGTGVLEHPLARRQRVRAVIACVVGSSIEWYDFFLYGSAAALVFPKLYFAPDDPVAGTLIAFSTYFVGFAARPLGAMIFGPLGDRFGRKATLIATLVTMGAATAAIGLIPGYSAIGIWGGVLVTLLRIVQGIGVGGEWAGGVLLSMEWGRPERRGLMASFAHVGLPVGIVAGNGALLVTSRVFGLEAFNEWAWRVPFLLSVVLILVGIWVRLGVLETPIFVRLLEERRISRHPLREVVTRQRKDIVHLVLIKVVEMASYYVFTAFFLSYGVKTLKLSSDFMLLCLVAAAAMSPFLEVLCGHLSDRFGRRRIYMVGAVAIGVFAFPYFWLLDTRVPALVMLAAVLSLLAHVATHGPQPAMIAETFTGRYRYTGASLSYHLASLVSGGPAPLIAAYLLATFHSSTPIALMLVIYSSVSVVALLFLPDRRRLDHRVEYDVDGGRSLPVARVQAAR
jgi:MFS family permease